MKTVNAQPSYGSLAESLGVRPRISLWARHVLDESEATEMWGRWRAADDRLAPFEGLISISFAHALGEPTNGAIAALSQIASTRGGDDPHAATAVVALLDIRLHGLAGRLHDLATLSELRSELWQLVRRAEPQLGMNAPVYLLARTAQAFTRRTRVERATIPQDLTMAQWASAVSVTATTDAAADGATDSVEDLADLLDWARERGVLAQDEIGLLLDVAAARNHGVSVEQAHRDVGAKFGVSAETVRRRQKKSIRRLQEAAPVYLAETA